MMGGLDQNLEVEGIVKVGSRLMTLAPGTFAPYSFAFDAYGILKAFCNIALRQER
jgi:hypothetical protein